jgi:hypothetical protein
VIQALSNGWFATSVSIRSGYGQGMTDRVLRLTRLFRNTKEASDFAHVEALRWIAASRSPIAA